jgi:TRAP-type C4-dicarboxylate transport system permease small subunit
MMVCLCFSQVFCRYILNNSIPWAEEASRYLFVIFVFLGAIVCVKENGHVRVDLFFNLLPVKVKRYYNLALYILMVAFSVFFVKAGWNLAVRNLYQLSTALRIPIGYLYMIIPFCGLCMAVNSIRAALIEWTESYSEKPENGESK